MMRKLYSIIAFAALFPLLQANATEPVANKPATKAPAPVYSVMGPLQSDDIIDGILQSIPSPLEISMIIKEAGTIYQRADLNDAAAVSRYSTTYKMALNLGIYGTDLGYANIYGKTQDALDYLNSVKKLADALNIGQFFDYATIKKLAESSNKLDELIQTTTSNFDKINFHLTEQKRENISALLLTGGWVEALYLTTVVYQRVKNDVLREKIAEQRIVLDQILLVLDAYKTKPEFPELIKDLNELKKVYEKIQIESSDFVEPTVTEKDGILIVVDNSTSKVNVTDADITKITTLLRSIRNKMIK